MNNTPITAKVQSGIMLLEALIAVLIFSLGILAVIALQAVAIKLTGDAKYRTDATLMANRLIGQMWVSGGTAATLKTNFEAGGTAYTAWLNGVVKSNPAGGVEGLPDVATAATGGVSTLPEVTVTVDPADATLRPRGPTDGQVVITLFWRTPGMPANQRHQHVVASQIVRNQP